jgi:enamine deaminase RidA (YjgF/YER057c/UK114 family)
VDAVVKLGAFVVPGQDLQVLRAARERHFGTHRPASTTVLVPQLVSPAFLLEIEAIAAKPVAST